MVSQRVLIEDIVIGARLRELNVQAVDNLMTSMAKIGLKMPISARYVGADLMLVAGRHRLVAAIKLGWEFIDCEIEKNGETDAKIWEVVENLHRAGLTAKERVKHIRRLAKLMGEGAVPALAAVSPLRRDGRKALPQNQKSSIVAKIVEQTGVPKTTVLRALRDEDTVVPFCKPSDPVAAPPRYEFGTATRDRLMAAWRDTSQLDRRWFWDYVAGKMYNIS